MKKIIQIIPAPMSIAQTPLLYNVSQNEPLLYMALLEDGTLRPMRGIWLPRSSDPEHCYCAGFELGCDDGMWDALLDSMDVVHEEDPENEGAGPGNVAN